MKIPKIFHYAWIGPKPFPGDSYAYIESFKTNYPDYEFKFWNNDSDYSWLKNKKIFDDCHVMSSKVDILKFELVHSGGIWIDADMESFQRFDHEIEDLDGFSVSEDHGIHFSLGIMGAIPNHPLFRIAIQELPKWYYLHKNKPANVSTGPVYFTQVPWKIYNQFNPNDNKFKLFNPDKFYPFGSNEKHLKQEKTKDCYTCHHFFGSWLHD